MKSCRDAALDDAGRPAVTLAWRARRLGRVPVVWRAYGNGMAA
jgi:hypothetical protein